MVLRDASSWLGLCQQPWSAVICAENRSVYHKLLKDPFHYMDEHPVNTLVIGVLTPCAEHFPYESREFSANTPICIWESLCTPLSHMGVQPVVIQCLFNSQTVCGDATQTTCGVPCHLGMLRMTCSQAVHSEPLRERDKKGKHIRII